jgi:hypothetical protein
MGVTLFVEVLDRRGNVRERIGVSQLPASIGRAYRNAVILDDPYVCPVHARIVRRADGELVIEDMHSVNGLYLEGSHRRTRRADLPSGIEVRVGHTRLRFVRPDAPVPPALTERAGDSLLLSVARSPLAAILALLAVAGAFAGSQYLSSYEDLHPMEVVGGAVTLVLILGLWAGIWSLVSRVVVHRFNFSSHYALAAFVVLLAFVYSLASEYMRFLFASPLLIGILIALAVALIGLLLYGHLSFASPLALRHKLAWSIGIAALAFAMGVLIEFSDQEEFDAYIQDPGPLKPIAESWIPVETADEYIASLSGLKAQIDELALER